MANLELYKIFIKVAEYKNITKASEKLNISQPAVTKHIKNLENDLGIKLFTRDKRYDFNSNFIFIITIIFYIFTDIPIIVYILISGLLGLNIFREKLNLLNR